MSDVKRSLPPKAYKVRGPTANQVTLVYALTEKGAIGKAKAAQAKDAEDWKATLATGEDLYLAAVEKVDIIDAPESILAHVTGQPQLGEMDV